jgi:hypothetical protein
MSLIGFVNPNSLLAHAKNEESAIHLFRRGLGDSVRECNPHALAQPQRSEAPFSQLDWTSEG